VELEHKQFTKCDVKAADGDQGIIEAIVSTYSVDSQGEKVVPGAFAKSLARRLPKICLGHDWSKAIGRTLEARETAQGLYVKGVLNMELQIARDVLSNLKHQVIDSFSIGYRVVRDSYDKKSKVRSLHELELFEWSPVLLGAQSETALLSVKAANASEVSVMSAEAAEDMLIRPSWQNLEDRLAALEQEQAKPLRPNFGGKQMPWPTHGNQSLHEVKSLGEAFVESREFQSWLGSKSMESSQFLSDTRLKTLTTTGTPSGWPVENVRSGVIVPYPTRQLRVQDLLPHIETTQNSYVYLEETTFTNAAVEVAENAAKPGSDLALTQRTSNVQKIACWLAASDEQLDDVIGVADYINSRLAHMVALRLDQQILQGNGTAPNLRGILNVVGIQTTAKTAGEPISDAVARAINMVRSTGQAEPNAIVMHPNNWVTLQTLRTTDGLYISGGPWQAGPETLWGKPVVITSAMVEGVALVGAFDQFSQLAERQRITVKVGYAADDFLSNRKSFVGETRVAVVWYRPQAFATVTGI
jgi:HK97 family phage major capsid protein